MAIVINGSGTVTGISVGGLPDDIVDSGTLADDAVATAAIADDAITLAKMASGTDGNIITYDTSGNPAAVSTGSSGQVLTSAGAGAAPTMATVSATDGTPSFSMIGTGDQDFADSAYVKMLFAGTEEFDTDSAAASSRFTVPSGEGGKYFVQYCVVGQSEFTDETRLIGKFYKNGNPDNRTYNKQRASKDGTDNITINHATILELDAADYVEVYCYKDGPATGTDQGTFGRFSGFKISS